jgi:hypothetical protein
MEEKMIHYIAMKLQKWPNMVALTPAETPLAERACGRSTGCLLVYDSIADLQADHGMECDYKAIEEKPTPKEK